jgi:hypothetical protein
MGSTVLVFALAASHSLGATIPEERVEAQNEIFQRYWGTDFVWKFDELPDKARVADFRVPYSGYIYPDSAGGTIRVLRKYDQAFNAGRNAAAAHEQWDTTAYRKPVYRRSGLFGRRSTTVMVTPHWHGHCNGWTAASIRHAEPKKSVTRNGVVFSPAEIKALLAEIYIYNENANLAGFDSSMNAGEFHTVITNWLGRGSHPVGMEADPGKEKWNYPIYGYATSSARRSSRQVDVRMTIAYAKNSRGEFQQSPRIEYKRYFHYALNLNDQGEIIGGYFYRGSSMIDLLWVPLRPKQGRQKGNERGNPHVDVDQVLALWRDSVPPDTRNKWAVVDPPKDDRIVQLAGLGDVVPLQEVVTAQPQPPTIARGEGDSGVVPASATDEAESGGVVPASATEEVEETDTPAVDIAP